MKKYELEESVLDFDIFKQHHLYRELTVRIGT